ncbi:carbonic anhydrase 2-like [Oscarella lobularis]|uniref:carbonic anhydrase 2-like n=1 Tax=Oscarella lobularis TaxID=121494 RepID=UPI0033137E8E
MSHGGRHGGGGGRRHGGGRHGGGGKHGGGGGYGGGGCSGGGGGASDGASGGASGVGSASGVGGAGVFGQRQSPIDITNQFKGGLYDYPYSSALAPDSQILPLSFEGAYANGPGGRVTGGQVVNDGHSVKYSLPATEIATVTGGALQGAVYQLDSFHLHFGSEDWRGSEHTVDGEAYPAEMHFVHFNAKYGSIGAAASQPDGLAVIAVFVKLGEANPEYDELKYDTLVQNGASRNISTIFLNNLLPPIRNYYFYLGSLTTPKHTENVTWMVMEHPIEISTSQMWGLRRIMDVDGKPMENNYRATQPLNGRVVQFLFD